MSTGNRLTADQLAALMPGDQVLIETSSDLRRPRLSTGSVVRLSGPHIVISTRGARGGSYLEHFDRRTGHRIGGARHAELVNPEGADSGPTEQRRQAIHIDALYHEWRRKRGDDALRQLHAAIGDYLGSRV